jgi:predicted dienelactone hydrolase
VLAALLLAVVLPLGAQETTAGEISLPELTGSYAVGRAAFEWTDENRDEIYSDVEGENRELVVWVWYPATPAPDAVPGTYIPGMLGDLIGQQAGISMSQIKIHAYDDAPAAEGTFPVLVFSHGNASLLAQYTALLEEIASHGYIVAGISHTYNTPVTVFSDGRVLPANPEAVAGDSVTYWSDDMRFVLDQLTALNGDSPLLAGKLALENVGFFGHSFGGAATGETCRVDARCKAGINLDGAFLGETTQQGLTQPFMNLFSDRDCAFMAETGTGPSDVQECESFKEMIAAGYQKVLETSSAGYQISIIGSAHNSFTDYPFLAALVPQLTGSINNLTIAPDRTWRVTSDYALAFFDTYLKGQPSALLDGASEAYPDVTIEALPE